MQKFFFGYWLTKVKNHDNITKVRLSGQEKRIAAVAQSVERRIGSAEVTGPIPVSSFSSISEESEVLFSS